MISGKISTILKKMEHCYEQSVFEGGDGLCPQAVNEKVRAVYDTGAREGIPFAVTRARMVECFLKNVRIAVNEFDPFASLLERRTLSTGPKSEILKIQDERKASFAQEAICR